MLQEYISLVKKSTPVLILLFSSVYNANIHISTLHGTTLDTRT